MFVKFSEIESMCIEEPVEDMFNIRVVTKTNREYFFRSSYDDYESAREHLEETITKSSTIDHNNLWIELED